MFVVPRIDSMTRDASKQTVQRQSLQGFGDEKRKLNGVEPGSLESGDIFLINCRVDVIVQPWPVYLQSMAMADGLHACWWSAVRRVPAVTGLFLYYFCWVMKTDNDVMANLLCLLSLFPWLPKDTAFMKLNLYLPRVGNSHIMRQRDFVHFVHWMTDHVDVIPLY